MDSPRLLPCLIAALVAAEGAHAQPQVRTTIVGIRERVVIRVPAFLGGKRGQPWREKKGPQCVPLDQIAGAAVNAPRSVDVIVRGGLRYRARFSSSCPDLDYYGGFYILPTADGRVCAERDTVRARSGGECEIERFRTLVPRK
ncbi:MAG: hypothetical protein PGN09_13760 [Sphingomonas fennica]